MALSFLTVHEAYSVLHALRISCIPELKIPSWPSDMARWNNHQKDNPPVFEVLGWGKQPDDGWKKLIFFVQNPSPEIIAKFRRLNIIVSNSSICEPYSRNPKFWCFGWF